MSKFDIFNIVILALSLASCGGATVPDEAEGSSSGDTSSAAQGLSSELNLSSQHSLSSEHSLSSQHSSVSSIRSSLDSSPSSEIHSSLAVSASSLNPRPDSPIKSIDIRADVNRDGEISEADNEAAEIVSEGVIVLPNIDDDGQRCAAFEQRSGDLILETKAYILCNDASDGVSNGPADIDDLTLVHVHIAAPFKPTATVTAKVYAAEESSKPTSVDVANKIRILIEKEGVFVDINETLLDIDDINQGVRLALEATDVIRDSNAWDGRAVLRLDIAEENEHYFDELPVSVAPVITQYDVAAVDQLFISPPFYGENPGEPTDELIDRNINLRFLQDITAATADYPLELIHLKDTGGDRWTQDYFEPAFVSKPSVNGHQVIRVLVRSAGRTSLSWQDLPEFQSMSTQETTDTLEAMSDEEYFALYDKSLETVKDFMVFRTSGGALYSELRGPDVAVIQIEGEYVLNVPEEVSNTWNSTGNFTTSPPVPGYPEGRLIYGATPNPRFMTLLQSQGLQPSINLPTEWLAVGHVDEVINFLPSTLTESGWVVAVADPDLARKILQDAREQLSGAALVFEGITTPGGRPGNIISHQRALDSIFSDSSIYYGRDIAVTQIDQILDILKRELGLSDADIVRLPVMYEATGLGQYTGEYDKAFLKPYFPNAVNGIYLGDNTFIAPQQFGPIIDGRDVMQEAVEAALSPHGVNIRWLNEFAYAHVLKGNVHCVTNAFRDISNVAHWWLAPEL